jgi:zinc protease
MVPKLLLAALAALAAGAASAQAPMTEAARRAWGLDRSDLAPHPELRLGVLANGMRYAVMRSARPAGGLAVRMRVDVGAAAEGEREQGFVHLIEHAIFHGSANLPPGAVSLMLHQQGLERWSDFNAFTSFDETLYRLDLARADARARETALGVMREVATGLRFTRRIVRDAKADVRAEIAARNPVPDLALAAQNALLVPGAAIDRGPITGSKASIRRASPDDLRRLYRRYYVPQRTLLVMVGDFDPAVAEAEIAARFGDWPAGPAPAPAARAAAAAVPAWDGIERGPTIGLLVHRAAATAVTFATVRPRGGGDSEAARDAAFLERLGAAMLARRLAGAGFAAEAISYDHFEAARVASLEVKAKDGDWRGAMIAGERALRTLRERGFSRQELEAELVATRRALAEAAGPRTSAELADAIADAAGRGLVFTRPADPAASEAYLARVRAEAVTRATVAAWWHGRRTLFVVHDRKIPGGRRAIANEWTREVIAVPQEIPIR